MNAKIGDLTYDSNSTIGNPAGGYGGQGGYGQGGGSAGQGGYGGQPAFGGGGYAAYPQQGWCDSSLCGSN